MTPLPVTVLGGYLGAGKTTLINRWLRQAQGSGQRIAVLVNDFGDIAIDADLIVGQRGDVLALAGGCVCCSIGSDLIGALLRLCESPDRPMSVLIETSGVALPGAVARGARLAPDVVVGDVLVAADVLTIIERARDRYVGDTVTRQLLDAQRVLLTRDDLASADRLAAVRGWLASAAPNAQIALGSDPRAYEAPTPADISSAQANGPGHRLVTGGFRGRPRRIAARSAATAAQRFDSISVQFAQPVDLERLAQALRDQTLGLARIKGLLTDQQGVRWVLQLAGEQLSISAPETPADPQRADRLVCIGVRSQWDHAAVLRLMNEHGGVQQ